MITIKMHDKEWFKKHCYLSKKSCRAYKPLVPKGRIWKKLDKEENLVRWFSNSSMNELVGKVLEVKRTFRHENAVKMNNVRYYAGGFNIPNWAIEWVKEE